MAAEELVRCWGGNPQLREYHDMEWGRPVTDERGLFERICLEGFQSGLSWQVVLGKRAALRAAFAGFDPAVVAGYGEEEVARMLADAALIRSRRKLEAVITNAHATLALRADGGPLEVLVWSFRPQGPSGAGPREIGDVPSSTAASAELAATLRRRGFRFVGPTTAYATMQAAGLVNDHLEGCWVRRRVAAEQRAAVVPPAR